MKTYLEFKELEVPNRKTKVFEVRNKETNYFLGFIEWDTGWRRYVFVKEDKFDKGCLDELSSFLNKLMEKRK